MAEAEVEYADKKDLAIDVGFAFAEPDKLALAFGLTKLPTVQGGQGEQKNQIVIWTTTPWTIPANQALNVHPEFDYALVETPRGLLILAHELVETCLKRYELEGKVLATCKGQALERIAFKHPFYDRTSPVYLGDYVTLDAGTGIVHSAPAYGVEDFESCRRHGMKIDDILTPVLGHGRYVDSLPYFGGMKIWDANPKIVEKLQEVGALLKVLDYTHSYMHCWRHKTPIIYRATSQWFAGLDLKPKDGHRTLRETALAAVEATQFFPAWGKARLHGMIANRPDWTLSRQRNWGVPMALFIHKETGALHPRTPELLEQVAQQVAHHGIEAWQAMTAEQMLGADANDYEKVRDTLDVWFDSGSTFQTVLRGSHANASKFPADLYLEGSDQHRGWFHSSLLIACMVDGRAPYDSLLNHGFTVDQQGRKMSKSLGNTLAPQKISDTLGAEVLRLWVGATDYSGDLALSQEILNRVVEAYRRIRNTLRFLLANTSDFDPKTHSLPVSEWLEVDRYAVALTHALQDDLTAAYARYEFHTVTQRLQTFCSEDLGGFYLDILKDRLYTAGRDSKARRSAQTALTHITQSLLRLMAPILSFTAEEAWQVMLGDPDESVFLHQWHQFPDDPQASNLIARWTRVREIRAMAVKEMETVRESGGIGSSLQAEIVVSASGADHDLLASLGDELRFVLITSRATLERTADNGPLNVNVAASTARKCERCWHYRADVGHDQDHPDLCGRCTSNLFGAGEERHFA